MKPVEEFPIGSAAAFRAAVAKASGKGRAKPKAKTITVSSEPGQGDRTKALTRIARAGFMPRWRAGAGFDFWHVDGRSTTAHASYRAAVIAAEREVKDAS